MTNTYLKTRLLGLALLLALPAAHAQFGKIRLGSKTTDALNDATKAVTFSDADVHNMAHESVAWMDKHNLVAGPKDKYALRLNKLIQNHSAEDGMKLNFKVYKVLDINAFACADGSIRVFSSLMDIMTDDELLGIIGHEIGHIKNTDTKDAIKSAYMRSAATNAASAASGAVRTLNESQLGAIADAMMDAKHSRKQELAADEYGYNFLKKYRYNVMGMVTAFGKLQKLGDDSKESKLDKMMHSHPDSGKRAERAQEWAKRDGLYKEPAAQPTKEKK